MYSFDWFFTFAMQSSKTDMAGLKISIKQDSFFYSTVLIAGASIIRIAGLGKGLWLDEACSYYFADFSLTELIEKLSLDNGAPLYYFLLKIWTAVFGASEMSLRMPSVIFTIVGLAVLYYCLRQISPVCGTNGAILMLFSPVNVYYAQEARNYALLFLLVALYIYFYSGFINSRRIILNLAGIVVCSLLICLTHNIGFFFIAGMQIGLLLMRPLKLRRYWWIGHLAYFVLISPWLFVLMKQTANAESLAWFIPVWEGKPIPAHLFRTLSTFGVGPYPSYLAMETFSDATATIISIALLLLAVYGFVANRQNAALKGLLAGSVCTALLLLFFSIWLFPVYIPGRTDYIFHPMFIMSLAAGISAVKAKSVSTVVVAFVVSASLTVLVPYYGNDAKNSSRDFLNRFSHRLESGDMIIATGLTYIVSKYYLDRSRPGSQIVAYPEATMRHPGYFHEKAHLGNVSALADNSKKLLKIVSALEQKGNDGYIILTPHKINDYLIDVLSEDFSIRKIFRTEFKQSLIGTRVVVLSLKPKL